jgi:DNA-binding response OmpR family regulator
MSTKREFESPGQPELPKGPRALRIVIADDERDTVLTLMLLLRDEGHEVRGVYTGRQVLDAVRSFDPDVVVLDIAMPDLSGWEVARTIRTHADGKRRLLIGISGEYMNSVDKLLSTVVGIDHYLLKPCSPNTLLALLEPLRSPCAPRRSWSTTECRGRNDIVSSDGRFLASAQRKFNRILAMFRHPKNTLRRMKLEELIGKIEQIEEQVNLTLHEYPRGHTV